MKTILITGGAGFIGSAVVRQFINDTDCHVVNVDKLTYAGNLQSLASVSDHPRYRFEQVDICAAAEVARLFREHKPDAVMHLAAESHVDRSISGPADFIQTNIVGTYTLLEAARSYWNGLDATGKAAFRFHHISTDEVYGSLGDTGFFTEQTAYEPNSPYSASKASSDHLVRAWHHTYGLPVVTTNCSNNYGPYQFPEKLIPLFTMNLLEGKTVPVYGDGMQVREWIFTEDHCRAIDLIARKGNPGEVYNIGTGYRVPNLDVTKKLIELTGRGEDAIEYVTDRPGHDRRYAINSNKLRAELGWEPQVSFEEGLAQTVAWYKQNQEWIDRCRTGAYKDYYKQQYGER